MDIVFLVRVKILAWEDRAKAQTAATVQYNSPPQRPFKRTLLSARLLYTSEWSASLSSSFFLILKRTVFIGDTWVETQESYLMLVFGERCATSRSWHDFDGRGAAELAHCWTGFNSCSQPRRFAPPFTLRLNPLLFLLILFLRTHSDWIEVVYTVVSARICCCQSLVHFRIFAITRVWTIYQWKYSFSRVGYRYTWGVF